jgi:formylglycine-generating enzyme required for sulfatase activity
MSIRSTILAPCIALVALASCASPETVSSEFTSEPSRSIAIPGATKPLTLVTVPRSTFRMGCRDNYVPEGRAGLIDAARVALDEGPERDISLSPFQLAVAEISVEQYCAFLNSTPDPSTYVLLNPFTPYRLVDGRWSPCPPEQGDSSRRGLSGEALAHSPAWCIPNEGAVAFCRWLTRIAGVPVRLPTEAEWEFSARNAVRLGVQGMTDTRCAEWAADWYSPAYDPEQRVDPIGPPAPVPILSHGTPLGDTWGRVVRGRDSWPTARESGAPGLSYVGFRVAVGPIAR